MREAAPWRRSPPQPPDVLHLQRQQLGRVKQLLRLARANARKDRLTKRGIEVREALHHVAVDEPARRTNHPAVLERAPVKVRNVAHAALRAVHGLLDERETVEEAVVLEETELKQRASGGDAGEDAVEGVAPKARGPREAADELARQVVRGGDLVAVLGAAEGAGAPSLAEELGHLADGGAVSGRSSGRVDANAVDVLAVVEHAHVLEAHGLPVVVRRGGLREDVEVAGAVGGDAARPVNGAHGSAVDAVEVLANLAELVAVPPEHADGVEQVADDDDVLGEAAVAAVGGVERLQHVGPGGRLAVAEGGGLLPAEGHDGDGVVQRGDQGVAAGAELDDAGAQRDDGAQEDDVPRVGASGDDVDEVDVALERDLLLLSHAGGADRDEPAVAVEGDGAEAGGDVTRGEVEGVDDFAGLARDELDAGLELVDAAQRGSGGRVDAAEGGAVVGAGPLGGTVRVPDGAAGGHDVAGVGDYFAEAAHHDEVGLGVVADLVEGAAAAEGLHVQLADGVDLADAEPAAVGGVEQRDAVAVGDAEVADVGDVRHVERDVVDPAPGGVDEHGAGAGGDDAGAVELARGPLAWGAGGHDGGESDGAVADLDDVLQDQGQRFLGVRGSTVCFVQHHHVDQQRAVGKRGKKIRSVTNHTEAQAQNGHAVAAGDLGGMELFEGDLENAALVVAHELQGTRVFGQIVSTGLDGVHNPVDLLNRVKDCAPRGRRRRVPGREGHLVEARVVEKYAAHDDLRGVRGRVARVGVVDRKELPNALYGMRGKLFDAHARHDAADAALGAVAAAREDGGRPLVTGRAEGEVEDGAEVRVPPGFGGREAPLVGVCGVFAGARVVQGCGDRLGAVASGVPNGFFRHSARGIVGGAAEAGYADGATVAHDGCDVDDVRRDHHEGRGRRVHADFGRHDVDDGAACADVGDLGGGQGGVGVARTPPERTAQRRARLHQLQQVDGPRVVADQVAPVRLDGAVAAYLADGDVGVEEPHAAGVAEGDEGEALGAQQEHAVAAPGAVVELQREELGEALGQGDGLAEERGAAVGGEDPLAVAALDLEKELDAAVPELGDVVVGSRALAGVRGDEQQLALQHGLAALVRGGCPRGAGVVARAPSGAGGAAGRHVEEGDVREDGFAGAHGDDVADVKGLGDEPLLGGVEGEQDQQEVAGQRQQVRLVRAGRPELDEGEQVGVRLQGRGQHRGLPAALGVRGAELLQRVHVDARLLQAHQVLALGAPGEPAAQRAERCPSGRGGGELPPLTFVLLGAVSLEQQQPPEVGGRLRRADDGGPRLRGLLVERPACVGLGEDELAVLVGGGEEEGQLGRRLGGLQRLALLLHLVEEENALETPGAQPGKGQQPLSQGLLGGPVVLLQLGLESVWRLGQLLVGLAVGRGLVVDDARQLEQHGLGAQLLVEHRLGAYLEDVLVGVAQHHAGRVVDGHVEEGARGVDVHGEDVAGELGVLHVARGQNVVDHHGGVAGVGDEPAAVGVEGHGGDAGVGDGADDHLADDVDEVDHAVGAGESSEQRPADGEVDVHACGQVGVVGTAEQRQHDDAGWVRWGACAPRLDDELVLVVEKVQRAGVIADGDVVAAAADADCRCGGGDARRPQHALDESAPVAAPEVHHGGVVVARGDVGPVVVALVAGGDGRDAPQLLLGGAGGEGAAPELLDGGGLAEVPDAVGAAADEQVELVGVVGLHEADFANEAPAALELAQELLVRVHGPEHQRVVVEPTARDDVIGSFDVHELLHGAGVRMLHHAEGPEVGEVEDDDVAVGGADEQGLARDGAFLAALHDALRVVGEDERGGVLLLLREVEGAQRLVTLDVDHQHGAAAIAEGHYGVGLQLRLHRGRDALGALLDLVQQHRVGEVEGVDEAASGDVAEVDLPTCCAEQNFVLEPGERLRLWGPVQVDTCLLALFTVGSQVGSAGSGTGRVGLGRLVDDYFVAAEGYRHPLGHHDPEHLGRVAVLDAALVVAVEGVDAAVAQHDEDVLEASCDMADLELQRERHERHAHGEGVVDGELAERGGHHEGGRADHAEAGDAAVADEAHLPGRAEHRGSTAPCGGFVPHPGGRQGAETGNRGALRGGTWLVKRDAG
ncbi:uncharacterized protein BcabD6B2_56070 [Babesia caballi]|uniref:Uncharacterized protein n=1 Tax=Babesia caballi TaxID=5871 RepID=A0AAV4M260_BABCB|nr:hypothetical protein BcabD6B2_56070 [Babesia caballi]